jgi:hypothetical protein
VSVKEKIIRRKRPMIILKSSIKQIIKKEKAKSDKEARQQEKKKAQDLRMKKEKEHRADIAKLVEKHRREILLYRKALKNRDDQHKADLQGYQDYKEDKAFFKNFRVVHAPIIEEAMKIVGGFRYQINEGDYKEAVSEKRDPKTEQKLKIVGAR